MSQDELQGIIPLSLPAASDLSASQFCFVNLNGSGKLALPSAAGRVIGVLYGAPSVDGEVAPVITSGAPRVKAGGTVTAGDSLKVDASGRVVTAAAADFNQVGIALESGVIGDRIQIALRTMGDTA